MLQQHLKPEKRPIATILAFLIFPISGLATDIYVPSMPSMASDLAVPEVKVQLTLAFYLVSYGFGQFFAGPIVDAYGRYRLTLVSLFFFVVTSLLIAGTQNITLIYFLRVVQGLLAAIAVVSKRTFFIDVYEGQERKKFLSIMSIIWSIAPIVAPFIGGYIQAHLGWKFNFGVLAIYAGVALILEVLFSGETIKAYVPLRVETLWKQYTFLFKAPDFMLGMVMCGISFGTVMFYNLSGPFIIEHQLGYGPVVSGYSSLIMGLAWMTGGFLGKSLISLPFIPKQRISTAIQALVVITMIAASFQLENLTFLLVFGFCIHLFAGFLFNNFFAYCLGRFPSMAGISGGLTGGVMYIVTSALSYGVTEVFHPNSQLSLSYGYLIFTVLANVLLFIISIRNIRYQ